MRSVSAPIVNWTGLKYRLFQFMCSLVVAFFPVVNADAAVDEVFVIARKAMTPDAYPDIHVKSFTKTDFNYDYELYQLSFNMSAGEYLGFSLGFDNYTNSPSEVLFDKVELTGPSGAIALPNPGFEAGKTGWGKGCPPWAISTFEISADAYEGSAAAKLTVLNASNDGYCAIRNSSNIPIVDSGAYTLSVYAKVHETQYPPDQIFAMEAGNQWQYNSGIENQVIKLDPSTFSRDTFEIEVLEDSVTVGNEWYEPFKGELRWWGFEDVDGSFKFEKGLVVAWFPASVGDLRESSTGIAGYIGSISMTTRVMAMEPLTLGFGTLDAYKLRYKVTISGPEGTATETFYWWLVPYLGIVKREFGGVSEQLISFAIGGGTITLDTDTDGDGLKDYEELAIYNTDRLDSDTDDDGLNDSDEINTHGSDPNDTDSDDDGLTDGDEVNTYHTDPILEDTDGDGLGDGDEVNTYNTDPNDEDTDGDDLSDGDEIAIGTNPNNSDTDADGMPDGWEDTYNLDPLVNDAGGDADGDGFTNLEEYNRGRHPANWEPDKPELYLPPDGEPDAALTADLETGPFRDSDAHDHYLTHWQIGRRIGNPDPCTEESFTNPDYLVFDGTSETQLTVFSVPDLLLEIDTGYCWRARFTDSGDATSEWADPFAFWTIVHSEEDQDPHNGIPDDQEADCLGIFGPGEIPLNTACVNTLVANAQVGIEPGTGVTSIDAFRSVDPRDIPENLSGVELLIGLMSFKAQVDQAGDIMELTFHSSEPMPAGARCYKYDPINGWQDYSAHIVAISADRKSITLEYQDGGFGDLDGVENRVVIDPVGFGVAVAGSGGGGGGGGCFISTSRWGARRASIVWLIIAVLGLPAVSRLRYSYHS